MNPINGLFKVLYWPICRAYAHHLGDRPADVLLRFLCSIQFLRTYRFWPNFVQPQRFSEKVWGRQLHERDPLFTLISDKLRVRDHVAEKVGSEYLIPLLWNGDKPEEIPFDELPLKFVIKTNHGCAFNIIVNDKTQLDWKKAQQQLKKWIGINFCNDTFLGIPWGYRNIKPHIIIESFLEENGKVPLDYKFFCFSGRMEFFKIDFERFEGHSEKFFDRELNGLNLFEVGLKLYQGKIDLPDNLKDMVRVAESLAEGFDFIRVDLYSVGNKIYFSELTPYPGGVSSKFEPDSFDYIFGEKWKR
jgi:TupA-like ATPgrasp